MSQPGVEELLAGPLREVFADFRRKFQEFQDEEPLWSVIMGFVNAVDWTEPWIIGLCASHLLLLVLVITTRKNLNAQAALFAIAMSLVYMGERINQLGAQHWQRFSRQDYFDPRGAFYSTVVSGPLLLDMLGIVINYLLACSSMLIKAKRLELKHKARQRRQQEEQQQAAAPQAEGGSKKDK